MMPLEQGFKLNNGQTVPAVGLGTWVLMLFIY